MRILFTSDLHGRLALYEQLTDLLRSETPDVAVLGGDMHPEAEMADPQQTQAAFVRQRLAPLLDAWRALRPRLEVLCILGNHDVACTETALAEQQRAGRLVLLDHRRTRLVAGMNWLGLSPTPPSPYWAKDFERIDCAGDPIPPFDGAVWDAAAERLRPVRAQDYFSARPTLADELHTAPAIPAPWIFVCHGPPHGTSLDRMPGTAGPTGSRAVREFIHRRQPLAALHGHFHNSPEVTGRYLDHVGVTPCVNPGQDHDRLRAVVFDTSDVEGTLRHTVFG